MKISVTVKIVVLYLSSVALDESEENNPDDVIRIDDVTSVISAQAQQQHNRACVPSWGNVFDMWSLMWRDLTI